MPAHILCQEGSQKYGLARVAGAHDRAALTLLKAAHDVQQILLTYWRFWKSCGREVHVEHLSLRETSNVRMPCDSLFAHAKDNTGGRLVARSLSVRELYVYQIRLVEKATDGPIQARKITAQLPRPVRMGHVV
jgi:predicted ATPase